MLILQDAKAKAMSPTIVAVVELKIIKVLFVQLSSEVLLWMTILFNLVNADMGAISLSSA